MSKRTISLKEKINLPNHTDIYYSEIDAFSKLSFFNSLSKEDIRYIITKYHIDLTVEEFEKLKLIYKKNSPTILELKVLAKYWNTSLSLVKAHINQIEIKSENKYIHDTLSKVNLLRKKQKNSNLLSLDEIFALYNQDLCLKKINNLDINDNIQALLCSVYAPQEKKLYSMTSFSSFETCEKNSLFKSLIKGYENGFKLLFAFRRDLNKNSSEHLIDYGIKSSQAWMPSSSISSKYEENKMNVFDISTAIGLSNKENMFNFKINNGDKIFLTSLKHNDADLLYILNLSTSGFFAQNNSFAVIDDYSLFFNLTNLSKGFAINIDSLTSRDIDLEYFLFSNKLKHIPIIVKEKSLDDFINTTKMKNIDVFEIGTIKDSDSYEMFLNSIKVFSLNHQIFHSKAKQNNIAIIEEDTQCYTQTQIGVNFKEIILKDLEKYLNKSNNGVLNPYLGGNIINGPYLGSTQCTPSQVFGISPDYFNMQDFKIGITYFESNEKISFIKTVTMLTNVLLKLVTQGYPIHQILLEAFQFNNKEDKSRELGEFLSTSLACFAFQNSTSIPVLKPVFKFLDSFSENPYIYINGYGYTNGKLVNNAFKQGDKIFRLSIDKDSDGLPNFKKILKVSSTITMNIEVGNITAASFVEKNIINSIIINTLNENLGFSFSYMSKELLYSDSFEILLAIKDVSEITTFDLDYIGVVDISGIIRSPNFQITNSEILKQINKKPLIKTSSFENLRQKIITKIVPKSKSTQPQALIISFDKHSLFIYSNILSSIGFNVKQKLFIPPFIITDSLIRTLRDNITNSNIILITGDIPYDNIAYYNHLINIFKTPSILDGINQTLHSMGALIYGTGVGARALLELGFIEAGTSEGEPTFLESNKFEIPSNKLLQFNLINKNNLWLKNTNVNICNFTISGEYTQLKLSSKIFDKLLKNGQIIAKYNLIIDPNQEKIKELSQQPPIGVISPKGNICGFLPSIEKCIHTSKDNYSLLVDMFTNAYNHLSFKNS